MIEPKDMERIDLDLGLLHLMFVSELIDYKISNKIGGNYA